MTRLTILSLALLCGAPLPAQGDWRWDDVQELGIKFQVYKRLKRIPLKIGGTAPYLKARYEPMAYGDYMSGIQGYRFPWNLWVYSWDKGGAGAAKTGPKAVGTGTGTSIRIKSLARDFSDFVTPDNKGKAKDDEANKRKLVGKPKPFDKKKYPYHWWEYRDTKPMGASGLGSFDQLWVNYAAVYDYDNKEIAIVVAMPIKKGTQLEAKYRNQAKRMLTSLRPLKESSGTDSDKVDRRDKYADTPDRIEALGKAKANIAGLDNWDYFTTKSYIVLWSYPPGKPDKRTKYLKAAVDIGTDMDAMRELYQDYYPRHEKMKITYSILRICSTREEFHKYGSTGGGVAGWFSPATKELVMFHDRRIAKNVAFHEGWHQYADAYFDLKGGKELQRWWDEGHGDFFGSFIRRGKTWSYKTNKMRRVGIKNTVRSDSYIQWSEIVTWNKDKFYGGNAVKYYEQGYAMVDFLMRGKKSRARGFKKEWDEILEKYRKTVLETKDPKKAVDTAFEGVDWDQLTESWKLWVKRI